MSVYYQIEFIHEDNFPTVAVLKLLPLNAETQVRYAASHVRWSCSH